MLIDHEIRIAQVFKLEGDLTEAERQAILTKTRAVVRQLLAQVEVGVIQAIHEEGGKSAGKVRAFVGIKAYEAPIDCEFEVIDGQARQEPANTGTVPAG